MTVSKQVTVQLKTIDFRNALGAVFPHRNKVKTGDNNAENRVRLVFAHTHLFVCASNGTSTALARVRYLDDSRGMDNALWEPDDGPITIDLQSRQVPLLLQHFKTNQADSAMDQLVAVDIELDEGTLDFTDVGGLYSAGESTRYPIEDPSEAFPDIIALTGTALAGVAGDAERGKDLVQDGQVLALFAKASKLYGAKLQHRPTGTAESRGFVVQCGPTFIGTVRSDHTDGDGMKNRQKWSEDWLRILKPRALKSA